MIKFLKSFLPAFIFIGISLFSFTPDNAIAAKCECNFIFTTSNDISSFIACKSAKKTEKFDLCTPVIIEGVASGLEDCKAGKMLLGGNYLKLPSSVTLNASECAALKAGGTQEVDIFGEKLKFSYGLECSVVDGTPTDDEKTCPTDVPKSLTSGSIPGFENLTLCPTVVEKLSCDKPENLEKCKTACTSEPSGQCTWTGTECKNKGLVDQKTAAKMFQEQYAEDYKEGALLPRCAYTGDCNDVNDLLGFGIKVAKLIFGLAGSVAFVMFIYGGFTMILSMGNSDKVKKGRDILGAAVIGLIIIFSAYMIVSFLLNTLGVDSYYDFRQAPVSETK